MEKCRGIAKSSCVWLLTVSGMAGTLTIECLRGQGAAQLDRSAILNHLNAGITWYRNSLAIFAGFVTAGIAVALQVILLSVAAYFFVIGRYGIRVGDRISVAGVTGDVIDVGLIRLYLMELAGTGIDLEPTGRVVVISNSVLFQAATPLLKQIPGTEYTWHEVAVPREMQLKAPAPETKLQFEDTGLEFMVRYPVDLRQASDIDDQRLNLSRVRRGSRQNSPPVTAITEIISILSDNNVAKLSP